MKKLLLATAIIILMLNSYGQTYVSVNLYSGNNIADGVMLLFDSTYNDGIDAADFTKITKPGENISIKRGGLLLSTEKRKTFAATPMAITGLDTSTYTLKIKAIGTTAYFLEDKQEHKLLRIIDTLAYSFKGNCIDRFSLCYSFVLSIPDGTTTIPIRPTAKKQYYIYNLSGQYLGVFDRLPANAMLSKISDTKYIKF